MAQSTYTPSKDTQAILVNKVNAAFAADQSHMTDFRAKLAVIDVMYARYRHARKSADQAGQDGISVARASCQDDFAELRDSFVHIDIPLVASQVDTTVGYLSELYLSGSPIFPVVSDPQFRKTAEYIEALVDKHSVLGGYPRELLMFFRDCAKYNYAPILCEWDVVRNYAQKLGEGLDAGTFKVDEQYVGYNRIQRLDPYNTIYDLSVLPGDAHTDAEYMGYCERVTATALRRLIARLQKLNVGHLVNQSNVFSDPPSNAVAYYNEKPDISKYVAAKDFSWGEYFNDLTTTNKRNKKQAGIYELQHLYLRAVPSDLGLGKLMPNESYPRLFKLIVVNGTTLLYIEPVYTPFDYCPMIIGSPIEDGFGLQTQGIGESSMDMQASASALVNIRFQSSRRAINDRALYDKNAISSEAINAASATAKIPVDTHSLTSRKLSDLYYSIPYDPRGTDNVLNDAVAISQWTSELHGQNRVQQGQFQKGNKTRAEFSTVMGNAEMRQRLPAIAIEYQVFMPIKQMLKLNISRFAEVHELRSNATGSMVGAAMDINELRSALFDFRIADGYLPSSKLASTEAITAGLQMLQSSELLQQQFGGMLPDMFSHIMSLSGVKGLEHYLPKQPNTGQPNGTEQQQAAAGSPAAGAIDPASMEPR